MGRSLMVKTKTVYEAARETNLFAEAEVVVAGAGPAGVTAASSRTAPHAAIAIAPRLVSKPFGYVVCVPASGSEPFAAVKCHVMSIGSI